MPGKKQMIPDFLYVFLIHSAVFPDLSKRTFFPGKSLFFWLLIAMAFYLFYLYRNSKNKKEFLRSPYIRSVSTALVLFFAAFFYINICFTDPPHIVHRPETTTTPIPIPRLLDADQERLKACEEHYTDIGLHYNYIEAHFKIPSRWTGRFNQDVYRDDLTMLNFYFDKLSFSDTLYIDIAHLSLGMIWYYKDSLSKSLTELHAISTKNLPFRDYFLGQTYLKQENIPKAIDYFKQAAEQKTIVQEEACRNLIRLLDLENRYEELYTLLNTSGYRKYFSVTLTAKVYVLSYKFIKYYSAVLPVYLSGIRWTGFIAALAILLVWAFYMIRWDIFESEGILPPLLVLLSGMLTSFICFYAYDYLKYISDFKLEENNLFVYSVFGIGIIEELVKILPLLVLLAVYPKIVNEPYDYILYAALSAIGFSFMENLNYFSGDLSDLIHGRALTSVPGHIINSSIVAYGLVLPRYKYKNIPSAAGFAVFFFLGALNHGLYDYWLFKGQYLFFIAGFIISISLWIILINNCLNNSPSFSYLIASRSDSVQITLSLSLLSILILEYIMVAWENGPSFANNHFNAHLFIAGMMITYYSSRLTNMDLIRGYWAPIPFKTVSEKRNGAEFDPSNFIIRFFSGNTFRHSFLHMKVTLHPDPGNEKLSQHFRMAKGTITDRLVVTCLTKEEETYEDPYWFRIDITQPIQTGSGPSQTFFFRFEEARPSFEEDEQLAVYLFVIKHPEDMDLKLTREKLRALGKAWIKKETR